MKTLRIIQPLNYLQLLTIHQCYNGYWDDWENHWNKTTLSADIVLTYPGTRTISREGLVSEYISSRWLPQYHART